jgi:hypothetical protein
MISFPHSPNDKERENKNHYANSDGGEPIAVNPISYARTHAQSDNERDAQVHRHAWRSCGRPGCDVKGRRRSYDGNFHRICEGVLLRSIIDALKRRVAGLGKFHSKTTRSKITTELLSKQHLDVGLVINHKNEKFHARPLVFSCTEDDVNSENVKRR